MACIDIHTHAFPDDLAERAIASLEQQAKWKAVGKGTVSDLLASMDRSDVDVSVVCTVATKPDQVKGIFTWCRKIRSDRIEPFPSVHPETAEPGKWLKQFAEEGLAGIKLHPMYQGFAFDEERMDAVYAAAAERGLIVATHCGNDIGFPEDDDRAGPRRIRRVADRFPELRLLCTHLGGWRDWQQAEEHLIGSRVCLETSFSLEILGGEQAARLIRRHGPERVLFGTDWPWKDQAGEIQRVRALGLGQAETQAILCGNAGSLLGY